MLGYKSNNELKLLFPLQLVQLLSFLMGVLCCLLLLELFCKGCVRSFCLQYLVLQSSRGGNERAGCLTFIVSVMSCDC